jgi:hypothetical protein
MASRTSPITSAARKIALLFAALVSHGWHWLGIQQEWSLQVPAFAHNPITAKLLYQQTQGTRPAGELALIQDFGKQVEVTGPDEANILGFARIGNVIMGSHQGHHFTSLNAALAPGLPRSSFCPWA